MTDKLLPCPFCGNNKIFLYRNNEDERSGYNIHLSLECHGCGASMNTRTEQDQNGWCIEDYDSLLLRATTKWNTRA